MGLTCADIEVENLFSKHRMAVRALVDSGAVFMIIAEHVAIQLGYDLEEVSRREIILADGSRKSVPMAGPRGCISPSGIATFPRWFSATRHYSARCPWK